MSTDLNGKTLVLSGGSRGIGLAIALRAAADGANIVLIAKTDSPHPRLAGTIHTAASQIRDAGGHALPIVGDVRSDETLDAAVQAAVAEFGGIDICLNNASVLNLAGTLQLDPKRYDLMQDVNTRGTFMLSRACLPHLLHATNPHILSLSPPLNLDARWLGAHPGYMLAKYGMTLATLGLAAEFAEAGDLAHPPTRDHGRRRLSDPCAAEPRTHWPNAHRRPSADRSRQHRSEPVRNNPGNRRPRPGPVPLTPRLRMVGTRPGKKAPTGQENLLSGLHL